MVNSKDDFHEQFARVKSALSEQIARARRSFVLSVLATEQEEKRKSPTTTAPVETGWNIAECLIGYPAGRVRSQHTEEEMSDKE